ncbi:MAG: Ni/Fe-hydrogenase 1 b-type cytochrome subunit [Alphaproteobacteria bacterium]|nr:Ni/Fe-hydrogenase 1 b-type cytochrome subunit [Alphaproteobacteria bacterium]
MAAEEGSAPVRLWDAPTRLVHWAMALLIPYSWWTATHDQLERHRLSGYILLGLLLFRLIWGAIGSGPSRFATFVRGPGGVVRYLRGESGAAPPGHNPLGGWSVLAMLAALAAQIGLGLFAVDEDGLESGPLSYLIDFDTARWLAGIHHKLFWVIVALVALHIGAILFYLARGRNLTAAMVTGRMRAGADTEAPAMAPLWRAALAATIAAAIAWFVASGLRF